MVSQSRAFLSLLCVVSWSAHALPSAPQPASSPAIKSFQTRPQHRRQADFASVRTRLKKDHSGVRGDPPDKYFHESTFSAHYDGRFADRPLPEDTQLPALITLVQTYLSTMAALGTETWLMHGSLLGWWWNRQVMPWDSDIDVQMTVESLEFLAAYHNMTIHHYEIEQSKSAEDKREAQTPLYAKPTKTRDYMLEINPHYVNASTTDRLNVIDARWVDIETGLFIDITALRPDVDEHGRGIPGHMRCKDRHRYLEEDIFPLRRSTFENVPVMIPYAYSKLLEAEYGAKSMIRTTYEGHEFDTEQHKWIPLEYAGDPHTFTQSGNADGSPSRNARSGNRVNPNKGGVRIQFRLDDSAESEIKTESYIRALPPREKIWSVEHFN